MVPVLRVFEQILVHYLVQPVSRLGKRHWDAGAQVAAGSVTVGQAGYCPFSLQRGETHLNWLAKQQHSLGQWVATTERRESNTVDGYCCFFSTKINVFIIIILIELRCLESTEMSQQFSDNPVQAMFLNPDGDYLRDAALWAAQQCLF